jgi:telomere length regulation protein
LVGLREAEDYDRHYIALSTAATLIRQKSGFGKEVIDHAEELASVLVNLNDHFEYDDFVPLRQEALIAVLLASPAPTARFLARAVFEGDFSHRQRVDMLAALGLAARELAGFRDADRTPTPAFPSKKLPEHLHALYAQGEPTALTGVSARLEQGLVEPMALKAADEMTGPNALKLRTFSSRASKKAKPKPVPNALAKVVADGFFFPLTGRWWLKHAAGAAALRSDAVLPAYLRTLAVVLHAAGPFALALAQMTSELWDVLLAAREGALGARRRGVLEALLFAMLVLLEVNDNKERLAREHAREVVETQEWARLVLEGTAGGDAEGDRARVLAASVVVRCGEVAMKWQKLMVGDMVDLG